MTIHSVSNSAELLAAFGNAQDGNRIELAAGDYDATQLKYLSFTQGITITSADSQDRAGAITLISSSTGERTRTSG